MALSNHCTVTTRRRLTRGFWGAGSFALGMLVFGALFLFLSFRNSRSVSSIPAPISRCAWPVSQSPSRWATRAFQAASREGRKEPSAGASRYRLAGTFVPWRAKNKNSVRKAILDDLEQQKQHLISENDRLGELEVIRIQSDRIHVRIGGKEEILFLAFSDTEETIASPSLPLASGNDEEEDVQGIQKPYGRRIGENRWVLQRNALMEYYHEMLDDPVRIARLYQSFEPVRTEAGTIDGYRLQLQGEADFLGAVGLKEGDHIRAVNSLKMTRQSRAEYFLREFVRAELGVIVLDLDRDGEPKKLVYMVR